MSEDPKKPEPFPRPGERLEVTDEYMLGTEGERRRKYILHKADGSQDVYWRAVPRNRDGTEI